MAENSPCDANALAMTQARLEEALAEKAAFVRKVKAAIAEARVFSDAMKVGLLGQRIVDIIERVVVPERS